MLVVSLDFVPAGWQRPARGRFGQVYTPKETQQSKDAIALCAKYSMRMQGIAKPFECPVSLDVVAIYTPPASWSEKKKQAHMGKPKITTPDWDNIGKTVSDAFNKVVFTDDRLVYDGRVRKFYGPEQKTTVTIIPSEGE